MSRRLRWRLLIAASLALVLSSFVWYPPLADRYGLPVSEVLRARSLRLGLDLAGGVQMLIRVNTPEAISTRTQAAAESLREALTDEGVPDAQVVYSMPDRVVVSNVAHDEDQTLRRVASTALNDFDIESSSGDRYTLAMRRDAREALERDTVEQARRIVSRRVDELGVAEPLIAVQGRARDELLVQLPGVTDVERAKTVLGATKRLEWRLVEAGPAESADALPGVTNGMPPPGAEIIGSRDGGRVFYLVRAAADVTGSDLRSARAAFDEFGRPAVAFSLSAESGRRFEALTTQHVGRFFAILLDEEVVSVPRIESRIPNGEGRIAGRFTPAEAADLALLLRAGALPASLTYLGGHFVGPSLGMASIQSGVVASLTGLAMVTSFMLLYYNRSGINALISIAANLTLMLGLMALSGGVMTLPGIAGLILTIGMGVDSNVLVFERIKEELAAGRSVRQSVAAGFDRVLLTILDTHVASLIAAAFLFQFGTGPIRGFATTLTFGLLTNVFTAIFVSRTLFELALSRGATPRFTSFLPLIASPRLDAYRWRRPAFALSALVIAAGLWMFVTRGGMSLGLDFSGGSAVQVKFDAPVSEQAIRDALPGEVVVQWYGNPADNAVTIRRPLTGDQDDGSLANAAKDVSDALIAGGFPAFTIESSESVGPSAGSELRRRAVAAAAASLAGITGYIAIRFRPSFAAGAIVATIHDLLITGAALRIAGYDLSLNVVAAMLTITGYSVNDTIVTFDRAREQMRAKPGLPLRDVVNAAVNQTFGRTVITAGTTLLAVLALYLLGGDALEGFAFAMLAGVVSGTYSTVFIATAILLMVARRRVSSRRSAAASKSDRAASSSASASTGGRG